MRDNQPKHIVIDARIRRSSTGRYVDRLVEHLQVMDSVNRYTVLTQTDDPWQPSAPNFSKVVAPYAQFSLNPLDQIKFARQLYQLKADLVHFPMNQQPLFYFRPVVTSVMDLTMLRFTRPGKTPVPIFWIRMAAYRFLFWYSVKKSRALITITEWVKKDLIAHYPFARDNVTVTYCASEPPLEVAGKQPNNVAKPFIMHVGSPFPHKNIERLIQAFEILYTSRPELKLVLAGKREHYFEQLEKYVANSPIRENIIFTGFIPDEELKWLYENAECYVLPSLSEGFGLPGLEAMAHNCPVVSSNATCLPEVYQDAAVYFDPISPEDIAAKITEVLDHPTLANELKVKGQELLKKYSWRKMAEETLAIYNSLLKN
jgi:glycosyltransferase involved in cell wall biosynthesis